jgi:hypothetical protein
MRDERYTHYVKAQQQAFLIFDKIYPTFLVNSRCRKMFHSQRAGFVIEGIPRIVVCRQKNAFFVIIVHPIEANDKNRI